MSNDVSFCNRLKEDMKLTKFDAVKCLKSDEEIAEYLAAAMETGDAAFIVDALAIVAKARRVTPLARETAMTREGLYEALSQNGNLALETMIKVLASLGLELTVKPVSIANMHAQ